jgi:hypothetical protein
MTLTPQNERRKAQIIRQLEKKAVPGNIAWQRIEELQGFDGDYTPADHGMHWSDNN